MISREKHFQFGDTLNHLLTLTKFVVCRADLDGAFDSNGIQLVGYTENGLEVIWEKELEVYEPYHPKWLDESTVEIQLFPFGIEQSTTLIIGTLRETAGIWDWVVED